MKLRPLNRYRCRNGYTVRITKKHQKWASMFCGHVEGMVIHAPKRKVWNHQGKWIHEPRKDHPWDLVQAL